VNVFFGDEQDHPIDGPAMLDFAEQVLRAEGLPESTEMAVILVGRDQMADYNERFMNRKGATDVLAFPVEDLSPGDVPRLAPDDPPLNLGDVFLCPVEIDARAHTEGFVPESFQYLLLAHGILHLLGYDHADDAQAELMERREDELLALIGRTWK
jgi:probable rRNA maturation factor